MEQKIEKISFVFQIIAFKLGLANFCQSSTGYLPSAVSVLARTLKNLPNTRGEIFQINFPQNDEKT